MCPTLRVSRPDWKIKVVTVIADEEITATVQLFMEDVPAQVCRGSANHRQPCDCSLLYLCCFPLACGALALVFCMFMCVLR